MLSTQASSSSTVATKLPRKLKKSLPPAETPRTRVTRARKPVQLGVKKPRPETPPKKVVRIKQEELCAKIARRLQYEHVEVYKRIKDRRRTNLKRLVEQTVGDSNVVRLMARYKGYESSELMLAVIEYIRTERPSVEPPAPEEPPAKKPRLTERQKQQAANTPTPPPAVDRPPARTTRKGRPKTVNPTQQAKIEDQRTVQNALDELLRSSPDLKSSCQASTLFWDDDDVQKLADNLKETLSQPRRVATMLRQAAKALAARYHEEDEAAKQAAEKSSTVRRNEPRAATTAARPSAAKQPSKVAESSRLAPVMTEAPAQTESGIPDDMMAKLKAASERLKGSSVLPAT